MLMRIVSFEINRLNSLGVRQIITKEKSIEIYISKGPFEPQYSAIITDVLEREFPSFDVAGGQFGKPLIFTKGNPHL